jgi:hypothetical protein
MGNAKGMLDTAKAMVASDPKSLIGLHTITLLTVSMNDTAAAALDAGSNAAKALLGILDDAFSPARKPANVTDDAWKKERTNYEWAANRTVGWVALQKQQYDDAIKALTAALKLVPADIQTSVWAGQANLRTKRLEMQGPALYHFARAAYYEGPGAYPQQTRDQLKANFEKNYLNFHGDKGGMDDVVNTAKNNALPPDGFKIESKDEILIKQEEELKKTNPVLALWISIKRELSGAEGAANFESRLKNANIPGGVEVGGTKVEKFKGKVVSCDPPKKSKKIVVGISSPDMSEVTLAFENALPACPEKGADIEWAGVPIEFSAEPFNLTFDVDPKDVVGLPVPPPPAKKAPGAAAKKAPAAPAKK